MREIPDAGHREMVMEVLKEDFLGIPVAEAAKCVPRIDRPQAEFCAITIDNELRNAGFHCPPSLIHDLVAMQQLLVPAPDDALALALARAYVFWVHLDDTCGRSRSGVLDLFADIGTGPRPPGRHASRFSDYAELVFADLAGFCSPAFLGIYRSFIHEALTGVLLETECGTDRHRFLDTGYIRSRSGFCEAYATALQFVDPCMDFVENLAFWGAAMGQLVVFLNDINDVLSFYKEALDGRDFTVSSIYGESVRNGIPYRDAYRAKLDSGLRAQRRIIELAGPERTPHVENYLHGYWYWHLHVDRYGWGDLIPGLERIEI
ncbi:hypothetical protein ABTX81_05970 [Kitasatospora sp. NPDC097605]|uniref:hypothetical protein n=1 Tax=Kitasatospora sp. NPDC097605 TaxID=3157226 RepID=UPI003320DB1B